MFSLLALPETPHPTGRGGEGYKLTNTRYKYSLLGFTLVDQATYDKRAVSVNHMTYFNGADNEGPHLTCGRAVYTLTFA